MTASRNLYREVSDRILAELKSGATLPWVKPWRQMGVRGSQAIPHNAMTGRPYSGCNVFLLWLVSRDYSTPGFVTFQQAKQMGGSVKKGEKGNPAYFVSFIEKQDEKTGAEKRIPFLKVYTVFNVDQCEGISEFINRPADRKRAISNPGERDADADDFITATLADVREGAGEAYYAPGKDFISLPAFAAFKNSDTFYNVAFHELAHWTGAEKRLDRSFGRFGSQAYAAEELVAELTSAFLCAEFGFDTEVRHAGYVQSWIKLLEDHDNAFFQAASKAQKAADYLRELALKDEAPILQMAA